MKTSPMKTSSMLILLAAAVVAVAGRSPHGLGGAGRSPHGLGGAGRSPHGLGGAGRSPHGLGGARNGTDDVRSCANCVILSSFGDATVEKYPWLFNAAKFYYYRSHDDGYRSYQWQGKINGENNILYLHFYDEGFLYDGFWVVNYDEDDYHNDWNNYVYTSEFHDCPEDTGKNWYIWDGDYWVFDNSITAETC